MTSADNNELKGLGGWLILVGAGVVISPIRLLATLIPTYKPIFEDGTWEALTTPGTDSYIPFFSALLIGEMTYNAIIVAVSVAAIYLFFSKSYLFPRVYVGILAASLIFVTLDAWLVNKIFPDIPMFDPETIKEFSKALGAAVIWIPYMLISERVRVTFVQGMPAREIQPSGEIVSSRQGV